MLHKLQNINRVVIYEYISTYSTCNAIIHLLWGECKWQQYDDDYNVIGIYLSLFTSPHPTVALHSVSLEHGQSVECTCLIRDVVLKMGLFGHSDL